MEAASFEHYQILQRPDGSPWELGRGAMAVTYKATDTNLRCPVALKVINAPGLDDEHTRARFVREARAAAALRHVNVASVYHLGSVGECYFYAMEFVDGETVEDLVRRRGPLPAAEALGIAAQVARALGAAAKQGLIHRDIKPANLMVVRDDDEEVPLVKVIDFGLARRAVLADPGAQITVSGFVGTPEYASPEQVAEHELDSRSDIYSLGVTLWFMLTGRPTFTGSPGRIGSQHLHDAPPWAMVEAVPASVRALLGRMLAKHPADRPQDPGKLRREIETCLLEGPGMAAEPAAAANLVSPETPIIPGSGPADGETTVRRPAGSPPAAGDVVAERFRLLEPVGAGSTGQMFRGADECHGDRPIALKVLRADHGLNDAEWHALRGDLRRLRAAPHPRLVEVLALGQDRGHWFVAAEWLRGFTLVDLLRRRGRLELPEALRLLDDACAAAAHGRTNGLHRLGLASREVFVHFPAASAGDEARALRTIMDWPLAQWPEFGLKIDALSLAREAGQTPTWAGAATLVPDLPADARSPRKGDFLPALGALLYEVLNGTPPPAASDRYRELPPLPTLGEDANAVLRRALSPEPGFRDERDFFDAMLAASGLEREDQARRSGHVPPAPPGVATVVPPAKRRVRPPVASAAAPRMVPTIRTKLLRPRRTAQSPSAVNPPGVKPGWPASKILAALGLAGLVAASLAVGAFLLWPRRLPSRPPTERVPLEETTPPSASPHNEPAAP